MFEVILYCIYLKVTTLFCFIFVFSASCSDQLCSARSFTPNQHINKTLNEMDYLNCSQEAQNQLNKSDSVDLNSLFKVQSVLDVDSATAETNSCNQSSQSLVENERSCLDDKATEFNVQVFQEINKCLDKSLDDQQCPNGCGDDDKEVIFLEGDKNECIITTNIRDSQSSSRQQILFGLDNPGSKLVCNENPGRLLEISSVHGTVLTTQNESEGCSDKDATNVMELNNESSLGNIVEEIDIGIKNLGSLCHSLKDHTKSPTSEKDAEKKVDSNDIARILDSKTKDFEIIPHNKHIDSSSSEQIFSDLNHPGSKFNEIIDEDQNIIEIKSNENIDSLLETSSISVHGTVLTTQNENEGCSDEYATNIIDLNKGSFVDNTVEEINVDKGLLDNLSHNLKEHPKSPAPVEEINNDIGHLENLCHSLKEHPKSPTTENDAEKKMDTNGTAEATDFEIISQNEHGDVQLMNQSFDKNSTSSDESNSDVFEDAVDLIIQNDCTKTALNDMENHYDEVVDLTLNVNNSINPFSDFPEDTFSSHTNASNTYLSDTSIFSNPSEMDSFEGSYLIQEPVIILETEDSISSKQEAESFALTEVEFMQFSSVEEPKEVVKIDRVEGLEATEDVGLLEHLPSSVSRDENVVSVSSTGFGSDAAVISKSFDIIQNISDTSLSEDFHCMSASMQTQSDTEDQFEGSKIIVNPMNASIVLDNHKQASEITKTPTPEKGYEKTLMFDDELYEKQENQDKNLITQAQASIDNSIGEGKSQLVSSEVIGIQEKVVSKSLIGIESDHLFKACEVAKKNNELDSSANLSLEVHPSVLLFPKESIQRDMSITLLDDNIQSVCVHESSSNESCSADNGFTNLLDKSKSNQVEDQNKSCQSSEISSFNVTDFIDNIITNETNDFTSNADQKSSDAVYIISSPDSNESSSQSLMDHGLQSFMEMTMANVNPAMYEQSMLIVHTDKPSTLSNAFKECQPDDQESNQSMSISQEENEIKVSGVEDLDPTLQSEFDNSAENISHEIMQQSMCDYVTNQVLQLTIPDADDVGEINYSNGNVHEQCETQTKNVLLMKWPPQFYDQLKTLQEENLFLSEQVELEQSKAVHLTGIEVENKNLLEKLDKQMKQMSEDKLIITELQNQNKQLTCDLGCLKALENDLDYFQTDNEKLKQHIEITTKEKEYELKVLSDKIKELQQNLISVSENFEALQTKNEALSHDISTKDEQIRILVKDKSDLAINMNALNERIGELSELESANKFLNATIELEMQKTAEAEKLNVSLQEQFTNLTSNYELLWKELKVSTTKEQAVYVVNEEKLILEQRLVNMKREVEVLDKIKLENKQLIEKLNGRDYDIFNLTDDKKKLKNSLMKANDKLNAMESDNEYLNEVVKELKFKICELNSQSMSLEETISSIQIEKLSLESTLNDVLKKEAEQNSSIECERIAMQESATSLGECIMNFVLEREWLNEQVLLSENQISSITEENQLLKNRILNGKTSLDTIQTQNIHLLDQLTCLQNKVDSLSKELNIKESQCFNLVNIQEENVQLSLQVKSLIADVAFFENEKELAMKDMNSLSEAVSNVLMDKEVVSGQLIEASKTIENLINEKEQLKQLVSNMESTVNEFQQSKSSLLIQLQQANERDGVIEAQEELIRELEMHISSLNEELFNEINKQDMLVLDCISLNSHIEELKSQNSLLQRQTDLVLEKDQAINDLRNSQHSLNNRIEVLSEKSRTLQEENGCMKDELQKSKETTNNLRNSNFNLSNLLETKSNETNTLLQEVVHLKQHICRIQLCTSSLKSELENSKEKDEEICELKDLIKELELYISSLSEELFSEMSIRNFLLFAKENLETQNNKVEKEKTSAMDSLKTVSERIHHLESENVQLKNELKETALKLKDENQHLFETLKEIDIKLKSVIDEKIELESKLSEKTKLLEENEGILNNDQGCQVQDNVQLREVMVKEIHSLSGSTQSDGLESLSLVEVYQKLMVEFLSKEREVIFTLQNDYEGNKIVMQKEVANLLYILEGKESVALRLEQEMEGLRQQLADDKVATSDLKNRLQDTIEELKTKENEIAEITKVLVQAEQDKEGLKAEVKCMQHSENESKLEEEVLFLNNEVQCKNIEISDLRNEIEQLNVNKIGFAKLLEGEKEILHQNQENINKLSKELSDNQESISELKLQLLNKASEVEELNNYLESKKKEKEDYEKKVEELSPAAFRLSKIQKDIDTIDNLFHSMNEESDLEKVLNEAAQSCQVLDCVVKTIFDQWTKYVSKIQLCNTDLESNLLKKVEECKTLKTQINCLNEELKAQRLLYDEDILQLKEDVVSKDQTISKLISESAQLKSDHANMLEKIKSVEDGGLKVDELKLEVEQLKEENVKLIGDYSKFNVFKEVNGKLSLEIEELSRSIKFEKHSNNELKAKCDLVSNQLADSKKKNFSLEDKIEVLENKLQNQNLMKSIKIAFPVGIDDIDKQVVFINEKLVEYEQQKEKLQHIFEEHSILKHELEKSSDYIKKQEEKLSKILKRELDLKKQIASVNQTNTNESKLLEKVKAELFSFFPVQPTSFPEAFVKIKNLLEESKTLKNINPTNIEELRKRLEEAQQENKDLDNECEMMNKHIKEQEEQLISVLRREEELKKENKDLIAKIGSPIQSCETPSEAGVEELLLAFPEKPTSIQSALHLIKAALVENQALTEKITESQEEYASLDKECEEMFKAYQLKESELEDVLKREAKSTSEFKAETIELQNKVHSLAEELEKSKDAKLLTPPGTVIYFISCVLY